MAGTDANEDYHICADNDRHFRTKNGLHQHLRSCYLRNKITDVQRAYSNEDDANDQTSD